jgi:hypothetical protein
MTQTQWIIGLVVTFLAGGAMGAVINNLWSKFNNRKQPIGVKTEIIPFINQKIEGELKTQIVLTKDEKSSSYDNLALGRVTIVNTGNKDYEEFKFGLTLSGLNLAVAVHPETSDRYHEMAFSPAIGLDCLDSDIDFTLKPFNRNDTYHVVIYILPEPVNVHGEEPVIDMELVTKHPVTFVELSAYRDLAKSVAFGVMEGVPTIGLPIREIRRYFNR